MKMNDIPKDERPREKLLLRGAKALGNNELLAIILRTGTKGISAIEIANKLLGGNEANLWRVAGKSAASLTKESGIGKDKAATLAAAFELSRRVAAQEKNIHNKKIQSPNEIAEYFIPLMMDEVRELFIVVFVNNANQITGYEQISSGILDSSIVHPREVFKSAIDNNAARIFLIHNHPSGNPEVSNEDKAVTRRLSEAGILLGIPVLDHIIIAGDKYTSLKNRNLL